MSSEITIDGEVYIKKSPEQKRRRKLGITEAQYKEAVNKCQEELLQEESREKLLKRVEEHSTEFQQVFADFEAQLGAGGFVTPFLLHHLADIFTQTSDMRLKHDILVTLSRLSICEYEK